MEFRVDQVRLDAVTGFEDVVPDRAFDGQLLPSFFRVSEKSQFLREPAERLDDIARRIGPRATRTARHAFAAIPDCFALEQLLDCIVVLGLDGIDDLARVVVVELGGGTDAGADAAVHAGGETLLHAYILHQHVEIFAHRIGVVYIQFSA